MKGDFFAPYFLLLTFHAPLKPNATMASSMLVLSGFPPQLRLHWRWDGAFEIIALLWSVHLPLSVPCMVITVLLINLIWQSQITGWSKLDCTPESEALDWTRNTSNFGVRSTWATRTRNESVFVSFPSRKHVFVVEVMSYAHFPLPHFPSGLVMALGSGSNMRYLRNEQGFSLGL